MKLLTEAKNYIKENFDKGSNCPCCNQFVKQYYFSISSGQIIGLINLYHLDKKNPGKYFKIREIENYKEGFAGGSFAKTKHWGLANDMINEDTGKRTSGLWAITEQGKAFVEGKIKIPLKVKLYNKKAYGFDGVEVSVKTALGKKFDYSELMNNNTN